MLESFLLDSRNRGFFKKRGCFGNDTHVFLPPRRLFRTPILPTPEKIEKSSTPQRLFSRLQRMPDVDKLDKFHIHSYYPPAHVIHVCMQARHQKYLLVLAWKHINMCACMRQRLKHLYRAYYIQKNIHIYIYIHIYTYTYM